MLKMEFPLKNDDGPCIVKEIIAAGKTVEPGAWLAVLECED